MSRKAVINSENVVENIILAEDDFAILGKTLIASETAQAGDTWNGSEFIPPPPPSQVPVAVEPRKFRRALRIAGLHDQVMAYIATRPPVEQDDFEYAISIRRDNPTILAGAAAIEKTAAEIDALFTLAQAQP